ncbi:type IV pilin-like G/H family protein [Lusitaniella coriacea]|uniref:type IV pilin-like G/H family protein n=1 Tax=Lusitaniella coriacea TaxID=1983105 RepID=UPI003CF34F61
MTQSPEFQPEPPANSSSSSIPKILLIIGGVGCGCFGLITILGILAAIALPSFLSQATKAKESEAKNYIGALNRAQQAHHIGENAFSSTLEPLGLGIPPESDYYRYQIEVQPDNQSAKATATPKDPTLKSFTGAVFIVKQGGESLTFAGVCQSDSHTAIPPAMPTLNTTTAELTLECPPGSSNL